MNKRNNSHVMRKELKDAVEVTNRCQRNWDRSKPIFDEDLETLIHVAKRSPAKQNETHYKVFVIKDPDTIYKIYRKTKHYALWSEVDEIENDGKTNTADMNVRNSQVWTSALFGFCDDWDQSVARSAIHAIMDEKEEVKANVIIEREKQRYFSMGISSGMVALSAAMMGYSTGYCSAFWPKEMEEIVPGFIDLKILLGIGHPHPTKNRREHEEQLNKDIWSDLYKTGAPHEKWIFPTFEKRCDVTII